MARKKHSPEQIVAMLRQIEIEVANHKPTGQACREAGITERKETHSPGGAAQYWPPDLVLNGVPDRKKSQSTHCGLPDGLHYLCSTDSLIRRDQRHAFDKGRGRDQSVCRVLWKASR
jgi:hypothetical protein